MLQKIQDRGINYIHFIFPFLPKYHIISNKSFSTISSLCQSINYQWTPKAPFVISVTKWKSGVIWFARTLKTHLCLLILFPSQTLLFNTFQSLHYQTSGFPLLRQKALVSILASFFFLTNYFDYYNISNRMLSSPRNSQSFTTLKRWLAACWCLVSKEITTVVKMHRKMTQEWNLR